MPNYKIIQDQADQARIKVYGSSDVALSTDATGNLGITSTGLAITPPTSGLSITPPTDGLSITSSGLAITPPTAGLSITSTGLAITPPTDGLSITSTGLAITPPAAGLSITPPADGLSITSTGLAITPPADGLSITSTGLAITPPADGLSITSTGLAITPPADGLLITSTGLAVLSTLATTDVSFTQSGITETTGAPTQDFNVLSIRDYSFGIVNSTTSSGQATAQLQLSPDGTTWQNNGAVITIDAGTVDTLVPSIFLKYSRVYYAAVNAASAVTLTFYFQGQT
ncbi:Hypothetical protein LUCI_0689 [Lucifera butyrica]|uniref:DUF6385 domain-containing protein n=1 Tax=Lucifera butyrica TaxID=1351585 RepID=A0A498R2T4_9FIRM|nr:DUF6385 domain-containing protein [Lucifera butyrica]VBB05479.1 Hypothetical protein LUCI_0689 [Lucifera butyrica]